MAHNPAFSLRGPFDEIASPVRHKTWRTGVNKTLYARDCTSTSRAHVSHQEDSEAV